jgi:hypothetical protein
MNAAAGAGEISPRPRYIRQRWRRAAVFSALQESLRSVMM